MLHAQLFGKLGREQENMEDILTSNVFGAFSYLPPRDALIPFLARAEGDDAERFRQRIAGAAVDHATYTFWPWLEHHACEGCEPDVVIRLHAGDALVAILVIEAKYLSGKSSGSTFDASRPPHDQLAREWDNARSLAAKENAPAFLLYVTADYSIPQHAIADSQKDLLATGRERGAILWLSWRALSQVPLPRTSEIALDVQRLLRDRYELAYFGGFSSGTLLDWRFKSSSSPFEVHAWPSSRMNWGFGRSDSKTFDWNVNPLGSWRWSK